MNRIASAASVTLALLAGGCGSTQTALNSGAGSQRLLDEEMAIEVMDLKTAVIILQSELLDLKSEIIYLKDENTALERSLAEKILQLQLARDQGSEEGVVEAALEPEPRQVTPTGQSLKARYDKALQAHFTGRYEEAIAAFRALAESDRSHDLADNAVYWLGESYYSLQNYPRALAAFEEVSTYPQSNKNDHALLKIGLCRIHLGDNDAARRAFALLLEEYPESDLVERVRQFRIMQDTP